MGNYLYTPISENKNIEQQQNEIEEKETNNCINKYNRSDITEKKILQLNSSIIDKDIDIKFPTIPSLTNVTSYIPRVAVSRITTGPPRSFASMVLADAFSPETLLMSGGSGSGSGSGGGSSSNSSSSSSSSSSSTSAASSSPSPSPSSNSIGTTITRRRKRSSVTKTKTKGNDTAQPKLLRRSKRLRVS